MLQILVPSVPQDDNEAFDFMFSRLEPHFDAPSGTQGILKEFHDKITARFPCLSSYADGDSRVDECPWSDGPLINNFSDEMGVIALQSKIDEVIPYLVDVANHLNLTIFDERAEQIYRPASSFRVALLGIQPGEELSSIAQKLAPLFKRNEKDMIDILKSPSVVVKKALDFETARRYAKTLRQYGCNAEVLGETSAKHITKNIASHEEQAPAVNATVEKKPLPKQDAAINTDQEATFFKVGNCTLRVPHVWHYSSEDGDHELLNPTSGARIRITNIPYGTANPRESLARQMNHVEAGDIRLRKVKDIYEFKSVSGNVDVHGFSAEYIENRDGDGELHVLFSHILCAGSCLSFSMKVPEQEFEHAVMKYRLLFATFLFYAHDEIVDEKVAAPTPTAAENEKAEKPEENVAHKPKREAKLKTLSAGEEHRLLSISRGRERMLLAIAIIPISLILIKFAHMNAMAVLLTAGIIIGMNGCINTLDGMQKSFGMKLGYCALMIVPVVNIILLVLLHRSSKEYLDQI